MSAKNREVRLTMASCTAACALAVVGGGIAAQGWDVTTGLSFGFGSGAVVLGGLAALPVYLISNRDQTAIARGVMAMFLRVGTTMVAFAAGVTNGLFEASPAAIGVAFGLVFANVAVMVFSIPLQRKRRLNSKNVEETQDVVSRLEETLDATR